MVSVGVMRVVVRGVAKVKAASSVVGAAFAGVLVLGRAGAGVVLGHSSEALRLVTGRLWNLDGVSQT